MYPSTIPWTILSSSVGIGILTEGWNLADTVANPEEPRHFDVDVVFVCPFAVPPVVHLGLTGFDADQRDTSRLSLKVEHVTESGFRARLATWATSRIHAVEFNWLAIGA